MKKLWFGLLLLASVTANAAVKIDQAWARATAPGQAVGGVFLKITSDKPAVLKAASCDCAAEVQIHESYLENGIARMKQRQNVVLPAGKAVEFKPGGLHIMLFDLKLPLKEGKQLVVDLTVETAGKIEKIPVAVAIQPMGATSAPADHHHHD